LGLIHSNAPALASVLSGMGYEPIISKKISDFELFSHMLIPGVGSFSAVMNEVDSCPELKQSIISFAKSGRPILGICLGMQILGLGSDESPGVPGLGLMNFHSSAMSRFANSPRTPHVGWNQVNFTKESVLFEGVKSRTDFYFSHSYAVVNSENGICTTEYGSNFFSGVVNNNVYGVQFHPERSQSYGTRVIRNFVGLK
jgi:glutamine amidotransferase